MSETVVSKIRAGLGLVDNTKQIPFSFIDTDSSMITRSDERVPSQKAVMSFLDTSVFNILSKLRIDSSNIILISGNLIENELVMDIGVQGGFGFGVGVCPSDSLPSDMTPLFGCFDPTHENYGNYIWKEGSIMVQIPKFYYRVGHLNNPTYTTYGVNSIDIRGVSTFKSRAIAESNGYALHRAFVDGGQEKAGFFIDKYLCSRNAFGTGYVASSVKNGNPLSTNAAHNPLTGLTACTTNAYQDALNAAKARDGLNGNKNVNSIFFVPSRFMYSALAILSLAHGQAAQSPATCAWYGTSNNYPKGCNNNALKDTDDVNVVFQSDGYSNCGKTGSASLFAKTTHNGQLCGVADVNGLMQEISIGATCISTSTDISSISRGNPATVVQQNHGLSTGNYVQILSITQAEQTVLNDKIYRVTVIDSTSFTLDGVNTSTFSADYNTAADAGTIRKGTQYVTKEATAMKNFTSGNSIATDHWGQTGVNNMMEVFVPQFRTDYPNNGFAQRYGNGSNKVLSDATNGTAYVLAGLGLPLDGTAVSSGGTNLFGSDYFYQYIVNELCLLSCGSWSYGSGAGVWYVNWGVVRGYSHDAVGFRAACYL